MNKMNLLFKARYLYKPLQHMNSDTLALDKPSSIFISVFMKSEGNKLAVSVARTTYYHMTILSEGEHMNQCATLERCSLEHHKAKTNVITLANEKGHRQFIEPIKTRASRSRVVLFLILIR